LNCCWQIRSGLLLEDRAEDQLATLADAYFAEDSRRFSATNRPTPIPPDRP
jgi:hypothetical protein